MIVDGIQCQFMISKEDLASGSGTRHALSELLCSRSFITGKGGQRNLLAYTPEGGKNCLPQWSYQGLIYFNRLTPTTYILD